MPRVDRITYDDFGDGIDRRGGVIGRSAKKFELIENGIVTEGRKLAMRCPLRQYTGALERTNSQGCTYLNGRLVTIAKLNDAVSHTLADADTRFFDNPEGATTWTLLETKIYNEQVVALVKHHFPASTAAPDRIYLHVFDGTRPTYVEDPWMPQSWAPRYPTQPYGEGTAGAYRDVTPRLEIVGERLAMTTAAGDVGLCAVSLPRVWNTLSPAEIMANGEMYYRILHSTGAISFTVPVFYDDLVTDQRYAAYVCEAMVAGTWVQFTEVAALSGPGQYKIETIANRFDTSKGNETRITVYYDGQQDGVLIRFRAIPDPPATIVSGLNLTAISLPGQITVEGGNITGGVMVHEGKTRNIQTIAIPDLGLPNEAVYLAIGVPNAPVNIPPIIGASSGLLGLNGQQRYWSRILASVNANGPEQIRSDQVYVSIASYGRFIMWRYAAAAIDMTGVSVGDTIRIGPDLFTVSGVYGANGGMTLPNIQVWITPVTTVTLSYWPGGNAPQSSLYPWYTVGFNGGYTYAIDGLTEITVGGTKLNGNASTNYVEDLRVGKNVEVNGEVRKVISISSPTLAEVELPFTTAGQYIALRDPRYEYAYDAGDTGNDWYATKEAEITLKGSGVDDAVWLGCSNYDNGGQVPVAIAPMQNRMLVQFPSQLQLWAVGPSTSSFSLLALMGQGAGPHTRPQPALVDGFAMLPTSNGPRLFAPDGDNKSYVNFIPVGDMLRGVTFPNLTRGVWWPRMRCWVGCASSGADLRLFVLSVHKDAKVMAWSFFTMPAAVTTVDSLFVNGERLCVQSGTAVYYFDPDLASFIDFDGAQVVATFRWIYNDLAHPNRNKKVITVDLVQTGKSTISIFTNPRTKAVLGTEADKVQAATVRGVTVGMQRIPVMVMGPGIALEIESSDPAGYLLDQVGFDYTLLNR